MIAWLCVIVAAGVVGAVVLLVLGWGGRLTALQRAGLCAFAAGLAWAGPQRALGRPLGLGDLLMIVGVAVYLGAVYGRALMTHADKLDGTEDGKIDLRKVIR